MSNSRATRTGAIRNRRSGRKRETFMSNRQGRRRAGRAVRGSMVIVILGVAFGSASGQPGPSTLEEDMVRAVATATAIAAQRDTEARAAQAEANAASRDAASARAQADAALERAAFLEAQAGASQAERDAARAEAETLRAAAVEKEAEVSDLQQRAEAALVEAREAAARTAALEQQLVQERRRFSVALVAGSLVLLAAALVSWRLLRRRRIELAESEAARQKSDEQLATAVKPARISCLLQGTDQDGRSVVVKIGAAQLGSPDGIVVGRNRAQAGVVLDHPEASREHFRLTERNGVLSIEDLHSTNGTFVNGTEIEAGQAKVLSPGDEVRVGAAMRLTLSIDRVTP